MKQIKHILGQYKDWLIKILAPLGGPWAIFILAFLDSGALGIPIDPLIVYYVHNDPQRALIYILMASLGSALGCTIPYLIGYKGGEALVVKRVGQQRFERIHAFTEKYGDLALIIPGMMPPGFPYKLFIFSAGVAEMSYLHFLLAVFTGRVVRFSIWASLTIFFGPEIIHLLQELFKRHLWATLLGIVVVIALGYAATRWRKWRSNGGVVEAL